MPNEHNYPHVRVISTKEKEIELFEIVKREILKHSSPFYLNHFIDESISDETLSKYTPIEIFNVASFFSFKMENIQDHGIERVIYFSDDSKGIKPSTTDHYSSVA